MGIFISYRIFHFPDITVEGSITLGASVCAVLLLSGVSPLIATLAAFGAGFLAGMLTGILHTQFKINGLLAGILVMTALYSVNLHLMGKSNLPILGTRTLLIQFEHWGGRVFGFPPAMQIAGWQVSGKELSLLLMIILSVVLTGISLLLFLKTRYGLAMRATGNNDKMISALGVNTRWMIITGLSISNGLIGVSGALLAQYQGFSDAQMGVGMLVWGLASIIIGEALIGSDRIGYLITGAILGSVIFRLLVAIALQWGMNPNDLKIITAGFVFVALILPHWIGRIRLRRQGVKLS